MDAEHRQFLDYQAQNGRLEESELELCHLITSKVLSMSTGELLNWNPYGNYDVLCAIRESRLHESSIILIDLDGCDTWPDGVRKQEELHSLLREASRNLSDAILGVPQTYTMTSKGTEPSKIITWDVKPNVDRIVIPESEYAEPAVKRLSEPSEFNMQRFEWLDFKRWLLSQKGDFANEFLDDESGSDIDNWMAKIVRENASKMTEEFSGKDPLYEILFYIREIRNLGWGGSASIHDLEELLYSIAKRTGQSD